MSHVLVQLRFGESFALLSARETAETALVFVHGFNGDSRGTWLRFEELIDSRARQFPWSQKSDFYFFGYRSLREHIADSSTTLEHLIDWLFPQPPTEIFEAQVAPDEHRWLGLKSIRIREGTTRYRKLVLVAHSQGALVARYALLDFAKRYASEEERVLATPPISSVFGDDWEEERAQAEKAGGKDAVIKAFLNRVSTSTGLGQAGRFEKYKRDRSILEANLRLFAPAQFGASLTRLLGILLASHSIGSALRFALHASPSYQQMQQESQILTSIREDTIWRAETYPWAASFRARVLWGENDDVVVKGEFRHDERFGDTPAADKDHITVCKPTESYLTPLEMVGDGLQ